MNGLSVHFLDGIIGAGLGTGAAVRALLLVDDIDRISLSNAFHRTFVSAISACVAFLGDEVRHFKSSPKTIDSDREQTELFRY